jgi:hypothetical protein
MKDARVYPSAENSFSNCLQKSELSYRYEHSSGMGWFICRHPVQRTKTDDPEGNHNSKLANRLDMHTRLKEFFDHHLKGAKAADWIENGVPYEPKETKDSDKKKAKPSKEIWK